MKRPHIEWFRSPRGDITVHFLGFIFAAILIVAMGTYVGFRQPETNSAVANRASLGKLGDFVNQSVSFRSSPGRIASFRPVPPGRVWRLQTLRALNCEAGTRPMEFLLSDSDGTVHAVLSSTAVGPAPVPAGGTLAWNGDVVVPAGWRIYARWHDMAGGADGCNWQYTALELQP